MNRRELIRCVGLGALGVCVAPLRPPWAMSSDVTPVVPLRDLAGYELGAFRSDLSAAAVVTFLSVPQGVAYALIAGLPVQ